MIRKVNALVINKLKGEKMDLPKIEPPHIIVPHLGEIKAKNLTINLMIWMKEKTFETPYEFLKDYLSEHSFYPNDKKIISINLTEIQLDEIAAALSPILLENSLDEDSEAVKNCIELKAGVDARIEDVSTKTAEIMGKFTKNYEPLISPDLKLGKSIFPFSNVLRDAFDPPIIRAIGEAFKPGLIGQVSGFQSSNEKLFESIKVALPDVSAWRHIANMSALTLPRNDYISTIGAITKQMSFMSPMIGDALKMTRPSYLTEDYFLRGLKLPGFEMTARAGLSGLASKALSANILSQYDEPTDDEKVIDAYEVTRSIINGLDDIPQEDIDALIGYAQSVPDRFSLSNPSHLRLLLDFLIIIIAVLSLLGQTLDSSEEHLEEMLGGVQAIYDQNHQALKSQGHRYKHDRVLTSRYHLREGPNKKTASITILNADRIVTVLETQGNWAFVSVYPYGSEPELKGWVYRYALKPIL